MAIRFDIGDPDDYYAVCEECNGVGKRDVVLDPANFPEFMKCPDCDGYGHNPAIPADFA